MKTINYDNEKLNIIVDNYIDNNLYVGLVTKNDLEVYADLTINIPTYMFEEDNEIIISGDIGNDLVEKMEKIGILTDTNKIACSGFGRYKVMLFNREKAKDYILL